MSREEGGFIKQHLIWVLVAVLGAFALGALTAVGILFLTGQLDD